MSATKNWILQGSYFETCNCTTAYPCVWLQPPTEGDCKLLVAWHIKYGHLDEHILDGLNVAMACDSPAHIKEGNWQAALYVDDYANDEQFNAIVQIFSGQQGGHPSILMSFVGDVLGMKKVKIEYQQDNNRCVMMTPDIAQAEIESIQGLREQATINNLPRCVVTRHPSIVAKSKNYRYRDYNKNGQFSNKNGYFSAFVYQP